VTVYEMDGMSVSGCLWDVCVCCLCLSFPRAAAVADTGSGSGSGSVKSQVSSVKHVRRSLLPRLDHFHRHDPDHESVGIWPRSVHDGNNDPACQKSDLPCQKFSLQRYPRFLEHPSVLTLSNSLVDEAWSVYQEIRPHPWLAEHLVFGTCQFRRRSIADSWIVVLRKLNHKYLSDDDHHDGDTQTPDIDPEGSLFI
jgi:hypothetical protein